MAVTIEKAGPRWVCRCSFQEKDVPKAAGFRWDPAQRMWFTTDESVAAKLMDPAGAQRVLEAQAEKFKIRQANIEMSRAAAADVVLPVPDGLEYLPYQRAGIATAVNRPRVLFGDEMGLGKTIQAIGLINADTSIWKVLIICPATLLSNWANELRKWLVPRVCEVCQGTGKDQAAGKCRKCDGTAHRFLQAFMARGSFCRPDYGDILLINYDILARHQDVLRSIKWDLVIADECHLLKNPKAKRTRAVCGIDDYTAGKEEIEPLEPIGARRAAFLTGTPIPNRPVEGWSVWHYLDPVEFKNFYGFAKRYCGASSNGFGFDPSGASNLPELQEKLRASIMVRRLKADVLTELPAKRRSVIEIPDENGAAVPAESEAFEAHEERLQALRTAAELAKASDDPADYQRAVDELTEAASAAFTELSKLRHATALQKVPYVVDHLKTIVDAGSKVVVFAHHVDVIKAIAGAFPGQAVTLYGDTKMTDRQAAVDRFQKDPDCLVFVGGIIPAGVGITLTASSHVVFAELDWVPGNMTQAEDRCHRIGQRDMVLVQHLVLEGSLDARMAKVLVEKQEILAAALDRVAEPVAPVIPAKERAATENTSRAAVDAEAAKMTPERVQAIHSGLQTLAAMDSDRARELNGQGFSKVDSDIGQKLASLWVLTPRQAVLGAKLVNKYRRQLPEALVAQAAGK